MRMLVVVVAMCLSGSAALAERPADTDQNEKPQLGRTVVMETSKGTIEIGLYEEDAPITTSNFVSLVEHKFYDGLKFHRYVPGFVVQGGDPKGDGTGGSEKTIKLEVSPRLKHDAAGVVAMARTQDPNSASSQFYFTLAPASFLDMNYAVFGKVTKGLGVVMSLRAGDVMKKVYMKPPPPEKCTHKSGEESAGK